MLFAVCFKELDLRQSGADRIRNGKGRAEARPFFELTAAGSVTSPRQHLVGRCRTRSCRCDERQFESAAARCRHAARLGYHSKTAARCRYLQGGWTIERQRAKQDRALQSQSPRRAVI